MNKKQKKRLNNIIIAIIFFILATILNIYSRTKGLSLEDISIKKIIHIDIKNIIFLLITLILFIVAYLKVGLGVLKKSFNNIKRGDIFDENFLMSIATLGAFILREFPEAVAVMLFYEIGELFQSIAVAKSRKSISALLDIRPDYANLKKEDGSIECVDPYEVKVGDIIVVKAGEKVALDGIIIEGKALFDTSALTGESIPRALGLNSEVLSGFINTNSVVSIKVEKEFLESSASKIIDMVENSAAKKSKTETFISKFAKVYTPIVVFLAIFLAIIPPIFSGFSDFNIWLYRALAFLVVSCPCALVVSVPLSFFAGIGASSKLGVLVKGSNYLEALAKVDTIVFDKTGTLTKGVFELIEINVGEITEKEALELANYVEYYSSHPIAKSLKEAYKNKFKEIIVVDESKISNFEDIAGHGIKVNIGEKEILLGNDKLLDKFNINYEKLDKIGTVIYMAINNKFVASFVISDRIKEESKVAIKDLKNIGISKIVMLSGDDKKIVDDVAKYLDIDEAYSKLLPLNKVEKVESLLNNEAKLVFVGDGINDAPVLARADIGMAMGALGSDAAIEAADVVIMNDDISKIAKSINLAKRTVKITTQNVVLALGIKIFVLVLTALGYTGMWAAVFADVGVTVLAIFNAMRNLKDIR